MTRAFGDETIVHLSNEQTGGRFSLWTNLTPPGGDLIIAVSAEHGIHYVQPT